MTQVVLDAEAFKALSSDTRLQILKALDARRLTVSELGRVLGLNKATVFEHLKQLAAADLVKKDDEGRKWVYYKLTWKGKNVVHPENVQFMLLLVTSVLSVGGLVANLGALLSWWGNRDVPKTAPEGGDGGQTTLVNDAVQRYEQSADASSTAPAGAPATAAATQTTAPATQTPALEDAAPALGEGDATPPFWHDANFWLLTALLVLLAFTAWAVWSYAADRRKERAQWDRRLAPRTPIK